MPTTGEACLLCGSSASLDRCFGNVCCEPAQQPRAARSIRPRRVFARRDVSNGINGDILGSSIVVARRIKPRLNGASYGDGATIASVRATVHDCPDMQRLPIRIRPGDRPPVQGSEIARQCGAAVRQERSSGKPGGLFLVVLASGESRGGAMDRVAARRLGGCDPGINR
jgi:hypothetical protein